jgi:enoyl-CoA hydratase/carnithine racemase
MNDVSAQVSDLIVRDYGALRRITLNRPKALNALTLDMAVAMTALLRQWAEDPAVGAVLLDGAGERGLCAGGDIRALYDAAKSGNTLPERFWAIEYHLNVFIARYPKPFVAVMDGLSWAAASACQRMRRTVSSPSVRRWRCPKSALDFSPISAPAFHWHARRAIPAHISC